MLNSFKAITKEQSLTLFNRYMENVRVLSSIQQLIHIPALLFSDALKAIQIPAIEVHLSKVEEREAFRQISYAGMACFKTITGLGIKGYEIAIKDLLEYLKGE